MVGGDHNGEYAVGKSLVSMATDRASVLAFVANVALKNPNLST